MVPAALGAKIKRKDVLSSATFCTKAFLRTSKRPFQPYDLSTTSKGWRNGSTSWYFFGAPLQRHFPASVSNSQEIQTSSTISAVTCRRVVLFKYFSKIFKSGHWRKGEVSHISPFVTVHVILFAESCKPLFDLKYPIYATPAFCAWKNWYGRINVFITLNTLDPKSCRVTIGN